MTIGRLEAAMRRIRSSSARSRSAVRSRRPARWSRSAVMARWRVVARRIQPTARVSTAIRRFCASRSSRSPRISIDWRCALSKRSGNLWASQRTDLRLSSPSGSKNLRSRPNQRARPRGVTSWSVTTGSPLTRLDARARLPIGLPAAERLALVVRLLALGERQQHLDAPFLEVELQRHEREALLDGPANQLADLVRVHQQLALPLLGVIGVAAVTVRADVHVHQPDLAVLRARVAVAEVHASLPNRLHLGAEQRDTRFPRLEDVIVVAGLAVLRGHAARLLAFVLRGAHPVSSYPRRVEGNSRPARLVHDRATRATRATRASLAVSPLRLATRARVTLNLGDVIAVTAVAAQPMAPPRPSPVAAG